ncbi:hypothetical protein KFU94_65195, partial [Chloroflexi bacterium TSY]|nr:hypothetical protein [Chloroflexi bacterium TSY]
MRQNTQSPALLPSTQWSALRQRIQSPSFADAMDRLRNDVDTFIAQRLAVPEAPGGHYHHYFCPEHGVELQFDAASPTAHLCPVDGAIIRGEIFDASWRWFANNRLSQGALCLAVLWQLETNSAHLDHVVKILTDYATRYTGYAGMSHSVGMSHPNPKPGIATHQTLDEAVWSLPITWAFDLVREEMSKSDIDLVENQLLAPIAEFLVEHHFGDIH